MNISFFYPAFNEEVNLDKAFYSILPVFKDVAADFESIVIDNCSTDRTSQIAEQLAKKIPQLKIIHNEINKGYRGELITGFKVAHILSAWPARPVGQSQGWFSLLSRRWFLFG
jgi:dolichol-phosphate mannosyltransferase